MVSKGYSLIYMRLLLYLFFICSYCAREGEQTA